MPRDKSRDFLIFNFYFFLVLLCGCNAGHDHHGTKTSTDTTVIKLTDASITDTVKKSLPAYIHKKIGSVHFTIRYHSPAVRGRIIWGGLVPFDEVWVTGAHSATTLETDGDFILGDKTIPAGKYSLFTIPSNEMWTVILNKNWNQHLADEYRQEDDIVRLKIKPDTSTVIQERLMYDIDQWAQKEGSILLRWEKLKLTIPVRVL